jgi:hypothetical protein
VSIEFFLILVAAAGVVAVARIYTTLRKRWQEQSERWDDKVIERLRAAGSDPFKPHDVSFFFGLPSEDACRAVQGRLEAEGFKVDLKPVQAGSEQPYSLHAMKSLRLSVPDMRELSRRFDALAKEHGGRYDGWTAGVVARDAHSH